MLPIDVHAERDEVPRFTADHDAHFNAKDARKHGAALSKAWMPNLSRSAKLRCPKVLDVRWINPQISRHDTKSHWEKGCP